jgi:uncharacterized protein
MSIWVLLAQYQGMSHTEKPDKEPPDQARDLKRLVTTAMPFGKHKGVLIADLPGNYLNWFAREGFPDNSIGRLLALMQEIDSNGLSDLLKPLRNAQKR